MIDHLEVQRSVLAENPDIKLLPDSRCWSRMHAHCSGPMRGTVCKWRPANSYAATWDLLHEIGHVRTHKSTMTRAESESAAIQWTIDQLRKLKIPVKRKKLNQYRDYVGRCHDRALRRGLKRPTKVKLFLPH